MATPPIIEKALVIPPGMGLRALPKHRWQTSDLDELMDVLLLWQLPRKGQRYVMPADISGGVGLDRSVADVIRVGTLTEPDEQVAQFVTSKVDPIDFAGYLDVIGRFYQDEDGSSALAAVETNNHGIATQGELQRHYGYDNFFIWQYEDTRDPRRRYSTKIGWSTTARTRPIILARLLKAIKTVDPRTGFPDYRINSLHTMAELRDFQTQGHLWEAEAAEGAHDDCVITSAIGVHVSQTLHFEDREPLEEQRRRHAEEKRRQEEAAAHLKSKRDYQNSDIAWDEIHMGEGDVF